MEQIADMVTVNGTHLYYERAGTGHPLVLRYLLGYPDVRVYDGAWAEWGTRSQTPLET